MVISVNKYGAETDETIRTKLKKNRKTRSDQVRNCDIKEQ